MKEKINLNYQYCLSEDESNNYLPGTNLKLSKAMFHPSFTFTGRQLSYMLNCMNGLILKINTNQDSQGEQKDFNMFNRSLAPIIATDEQKYPRGKNPFKTKSTKKGVSTATAEEAARKHINREFFVGHRYKVL